MPVPADKMRSYLARQVGSLALAGMRPQNPMGQVRSAAWHNELLRLGVPLPLFVVHDLGLLITSGGSPIGVDPGRQQAITARGELPELARAYDALLVELSQGEVVKSATSLSLRDDMVGVILHRLLNHLYQLWPDRRAWVGAEELAMDPGVYTGADLLGHFRDFDSTPLASLLAHLVRHRLYLLTAVEQIDLDTLRLLGLFQRDKGDAPLDLADLLSVFSSAQANDVVNFSLDLLPSVLETRRQGGAQSFSIDGYATLERRGSVDSVLLSEFAYPRDMFEQKVLDQELLYYGHEKETKEQRRLQYILVDCSASMRGVREVFARGLALTLIKKLGLQGDEVWLRFFDSRLYELHRDAEGSVLHLLSFRSERGRNYDRVFRQLLYQLQQQRRTDSRQMVIYLITHGQCHISNELVRRMAQVASLYGIIILPSQELHLDYLTLLGRHQIVSRQALSSRQGRVDRAREILDDVEDAREAATEGLDV